MSQTFSLAFILWTGAVMPRAEKVLHHAVESLVDEALTPINAGGRMPVDTGYLRSSAQVSVNVSNTHMADIPDPDATYSFDGAALANDIASARVGDTLYLTFAAPYAYAQEMGTSRHPANAFLRTAAANWHAHVEAAVDAVRND